MINISKFLKDKERVVITFEDYVNRLSKNPKMFLQTSSSIICDAIRNFGYKIVIRNGEPIISYNVFDDPFSDGMYAAFGHEFLVQKMMDLIESCDKESYMKRGIILVGPPSTGKTNMIDVMLKASEEYTKSKEMEVYTFYIEFKSKEEGDGRTVILNPSFNHSPLLLIPVSVRSENKVEYPRRDFFEQLTKEHEGLTVPNFFKYGTLDKPILNIIDDICRTNKISYKEAIDQYVRIERIVFSIPQGKGISNIDNMRKLNVDTIPTSLSQSASEVLEQHLSDPRLFKYEGAPISANRCALHIHDAFHDEKDNTYYRPLLMLLGSGKISLETTQNHLDTTVFITTNLEEMVRLETCLTSHKLLDRIEKVPVNYLLDSTHEMMILDRDMSYIDEQYDVDPNLKRIASYFSVLTRIMPTTTKNFPESWSEEKQWFYRTLSPEQKLFLYLCGAKDPLKVIENIPAWHPFRNEAAKLGIDLSHPKKYQEMIYENPYSLTLEESSVFSNHQLKIIDDDLIKFLAKEHYPNEGTHGMSVRQLQNVIRNVVGNSDGKKITSIQFIQSLEKIITEGSDIHYWLKDEYIFEQWKKHCEENESLQESRYIGQELFAENNGVYGNYKDLANITKAIYHDIIAKEITICTVNRDPEQIEKDFRKYIQYILLDRAGRNHAFSTMMRDKYSFVDYLTGEMIENPDYNFMESVEKIINKSTHDQSYRDSIYEKYSLSIMRNEISISQDINIINSSNDGLIDCFEGEYTRLLAHKKTIEGLDVDQLSDSFFYRVNDISMYYECDKNIKSMSEEIIDAMSSKYNYSTEMALDIVVYGLRSKVIDFSNILK